MRKWFTRFLLLFFIVVGVGGLAVYMLVHYSPASHRVIEKKETPPEKTGMETQVISSTHNVPPAESVSPTPSPTPGELTTVANRAVFNQPMKAAPMRMYTATDVEAPKQEEEDLGAFAPACRMIKCRLVFSVDSSNNATTPIDGMVIDDLVWRGKMIVRKCSEVHGIAQTEKDRESITAEGAWIITMAESDGLGNRELVVKGQAMDCEDDPAFKELFVGSQPIDRIHGSWGITDGKSGLRGVVIRSNNQDIVAAFVATFIAGVARSAEGSVTNIYGQTVASPNVYGAGGIPGYAINPLAEGAGAVLDRYAQMVMDSIERDGFFIRVPAGKLFYLRVLEDIHTGKATVGGSARLREVQHDFLEDRELREKVTDPRAAREERRRQEYQPIDPIMTHRLNDAAAAIEGRAQPTPTP